MAQKSISMSITRLFNNTVHDQVQAATLKAPFEGFVHVTRTERNMEMIEIQFRSKRFVSPLVQSYDGNEGFHGRKRSCLVP